MARLCAAVPHQGDPSGRAVRRKSTRISLIASGRSRLGRWPAHSSLTRRAAGRRLARSSEIPRKSATSCAPDTTSVGTAIADTIFSPAREAAVSWLYFVFFPIEIWWWPRRQAQLLANAERAEESARRLLEEERADG